MDGPAQRTADAVPARSGTRHRNRHDGVLPCRRSQAGEAAIAPLRAIRDPLAVVAGVQPFVAFQQIFDPLLAPGARNYWKSHDLHDLGDAAMEALIDAAGRLPDDESEIFVAHLGGAVGRVSPEATAFVQRTPHFVVNIHTRWQDPSKDAFCRGWARDLFEALSPYSAGVYVNFMPADDAGRLVDAYGANLARLAAVKARHDPENRFRLNQNITPETSERLAG